MAYLLSLAVFFGHAYHLYEFTVYDLFIGSVAIFLVLSGRKIRYGRKLVGLVLALIAYAVLTIIVNRTDDLAQYLSIGYYVEFLVSVILVLTLDIDMKKVWNTVFVLVIVDNIIAIASFVLHQGHIQAVGLSGTGLHWMTIPYIIYVMITREIKPRSRLVLEIVLVTGLLSTNQRIGWVTLLVSLLVAMFVLRDNRVSLMKGVVPVIGLVILFLAIPSEARSVVIARLSQIRDGSGTIGYRLVLWKSAWRAFLDKPILGIGSGAFARNLRSIVRVDEASYQLIVASGLSTHNSFLEALAELGILGASLYYSTAMYILAYSKRVLTVTRKDAITRSAYICLIAYTILDLYGQGTFYPYYTYLFMVVVAAGRHASNHTAHLGGG